MEEKKICAMSRRLRLPEAVLPALSAAAEMLPEDLPVGALSEPSTAEEAWRTAAGLLPPWQEDGGMAHLAVMLLAACRTEERLRERGVSEAVFLDTMDCFRRFLEESRARTGQYAFDRGFWTWRQTGGLLFRLGTLEFESHRAGAGPLPEGLEAETPVLSTHIPSDAVLERAELDRSYGMAWAFFSRERLCPFGRPRAAVCRSWLLAPPLRALLPPDSGIRRFAGDYRLFEVDEEDREFYQWLFDGHREDLPERTSLQRAVKAHLAGGGRIGMARGILTRRYPEDSSAAIPKSCEQSVSNHPGRCRERREAPPGPQSSQ